MAAKVLAVLKVPTPDVGHPLVSKKKMSGPVEEVVLTDVRNRAAVLGNGLVWLYVAGTRPDGEPGAFYGALGCGWNVPHLEPSEDLAEGAEVQLRCRQGESPARAVPFKPTIGWWAASEIDEPVWFGDNGAYPTYDVDGRPVDARGHSTSILQECGLMHISELQRMGSGKSGFFRDLYRDVADVYATQ